METKKKTTGKIIMLWLLVAVLVLPFVVKSVHYHCIDTICAGCGGHTHHDSDNCPVCQFALFSFVKAEQVELAVLTADSVILPAACRNIPPFRFVCPCRVRGPPAA
ncbi:MAG: hypothetical protein LBS03_06160 [Bacteroidales bacterium]|nr:hypothetical protein [Bacteroidales bacterium]